MCVWLERMTIELNVCVYVHVLGKGSAFVYVCSSSNKQVFVYLFKGYEKQVCTCGERSKIKYNEINPVCDEEWVWLSGERQTPQGYTFQQSGQSCGYAYVEFQHYEVAQIVAKHMDGYLTFGKIMKCTWFFILHLRLSIYKARNVEDLVKTPHFHTHWWSRQKISHC